MKEKLSAAVYAVKRTVYAADAHITVGEGVVIRGVPYLKSYGGLITIGKGSIIEKKTRLCSREHGEIQIGERVYLNESCLAVSRGRILIGDDTLLGPGVYIYDHNHRFNKKSISRDMFEAGDVIIEAGCWIGAGCMILKGAWVGKGSVIGAGSVVHGRIPPHSLVRPSAPVITELR